MCKINVFLKLSFAFFKKNAIKGEKMFLNISSLSVKKYSIMVC